uniref:Uncharacterized protein n=1 Tax=Aotus nancymaae TaxID=37293 RepID=A0A2K5CVC4_AOTNA
MVRIGAMIMIVLILLRIGPNPRRQRGRRPPKPSPRTLFAACSCWVSGVGTWSSPDENRVWRPAWRQGPKREPDPRGLRPRKPVLGTGDGDPATRRRRQDASEQDTRPGNDFVASPEIAEPPSPAGIRAQDRAPRHRRAPPTRMPVAPALSADGEPGWGAGGRRTLPFHCTGSVHNWLELNTWMKVERLLVEKFHQSFSFDH